jgi:TRAP-type mannitol/chloroaromatic compound transport system permease large subunit
MGDIIRGVLPFVGIVTVVLVLLVLFPQIVTWLPEKMITSFR